ncbi:MAG: amidohydrolase family protein [Acidimicrobiales bacterium]
MREAIAAMPAVDQHAHVLSRPGSEVPSLARVLTESDDPAVVAQVRHLPAYHRAVADLEALDALGAGGDPRRVLAACGFSAVLIDDGFVFPGAGTLADFAALVDRPVHRIVRIESVAEPFAGGSFDSAVAAFRDALATALDAGAVALKTIAAYRGGLDLRPVDLATARAAYGSWHGRLDDPALVSFFVHEAVDVARPRRVPLQVHTGMGDADLALDRADPLLLRPLIDHAAPDVPVVLLHCHPFVARASLLAGLYAHVHLDLSLAMTHASHLGPDLILEALGQAPASKLLFATDASRLAEAFYLGSRWWRESLVRALTRLVDDAHITGPTALDWAAKILAGNARSLYRL